MAFAMKSSVARSSVAARRVPARSAVRMHAAADRPMWYPGNPAPAHLDGTLAGDFGFDPLNLGSDPVILSWMVQAELQHCRWAMLGAAGVLYTGIAAQAGLDFPQWYDAGEVSLKQTGIPLSSLLAVQFALFHWAETKRYWDWKNPGSQGDGSFFGITDDFKGKENGYPGGLYFDPFGLSRGTDAQYKKYKESEVRNGRLAMIANLGFWAQHAAIPGKGPIQNLADHLADPAHVTYATNGVSVPFL